MSVRDAVRAALLLYPAEDWLDPVEDYARVYLKDQGLDGKDVRAAVRGIEQMLDKTEDPDERTEEILTASLDRYLQYTLETGLADEGMTKTWVATDDDKVRASHREADGQTVGVRESFTVGGFSMMGPHDVTADPSEWVGCRCQLRIGSNVTAAAGPPKDENFVIVALPAESDQINEISSETYAHITMLYLPMSALEAAKAHIGNFVTEVQVKNRGELGDDGADVLFLDPGALLSAREEMLADPVIRQAYDSIEQYPEWTPHLTLGYPESPAMEGDIPDTIEIARLAIMIDDDSIITGDDMEDDETTEVDQVDDFEDDQPIPDEPVPFHGVAVVEGVRTGDMRKFAQGALTWLDGGMDFAWVKTDQAGHDGAVVVGRIHTMWREGDEIRYQGVYHDTPEAAELIAYQAEGSYRGVSVDVDDSYEATVETLDGEPYTGDVFESDAPLVEVYTNGRIRGLTTVRIQAFPEAWVSLGPWPEEELEQSEPDEDMVASAAELDETITPLSEDEESHFKIDEGEWDGSASKYTPEQWYAATIVHLSDDKENKSDHKLPIKTPGGNLSRAGVHAAASRLNQTDAPPEKISKAKAALRSAYRELGEDPPENITAGAFAPGTQDGPGWLTHPVDTDRLRDYWVRGPGAAKIGWGLPGDFNRCRTLLAKYVKPQHLAGYCANRHKDALGIWPGQHRSGGTEPGVSINIVASGRPDVLPAEWFEDPKLTGPSPIVVTEDGRVYGHAAQWGVCHIGFPNACVTAPSSRTNYAHFRTGYVVTDKGDIPVGRITQGTGHPGLDASPAETMAHYDNTGTCVAYVAAGEDAYGIWVAGATRSGITAEEVETLRGSVLSGDWRGIGGSSEMVHVLAVNVGGFGIPRLALAASGGHQTALVAAGIVPNDGPVEEKTLKEIVGAAVSETLSRIEARKEFAAIREQIQRQVASEFRAIQMRTLRSE